MGWLVDHEGTETIERMCQMRGKPFLAALVAFLFVFLGGAAIAGVSDFSPLQAKAQEVVVSDRPPAEPATTTSTIAVAAADDGRASLSSVPLSRETGERQRARRIEGASATDTTPPRFEILYPDNPSRTEEAVVVVGGSVEPGAKVILGDRRAHVDGDEWKIKVELRPGWNELKFHAFDEAGNVTRRGIAIFRIVHDEDTTPPRFLISSPDDGAEVHEQVIVVAGRVEEGATVIYGDRRAHVDGTYWKIKVELVPGKNLLGFKAVDEAGNATRRSITVYLVREGDTTPPRFAITSPANESETHERVIVVSGAVEPGAKVFYGDRRAHVEGDHWKIEVELEKGKNVLSFKAVDEAGNWTKRSVTVWLVRDDVPDYEFRAAQKYGSCGEPVPYDVFYGKGEPESVIEVTSEYGGGRVEVGESGEWKIKVYFEGSPFGETFKVTVHASTGEEAHFTFTNTGSKPDTEHDT